MASFAHARAVVAEHVALRWKLAALERCSAHLDRGEHTAALSAYAVARRDPLADEVVRRAVDEMALALAAPTSQAPQ